MAKMPELFRGRNASVTAFEAYCCFPDIHQPTNVDVQWRRPAKGWLLDYMNIAYYEGVMLICGVIFVVVAGGLDVM